VVRVDASHPDQELLDRAGGILRDGGLVAFPTETVYGIAASLVHPGGLGRLREVKRCSDERSFTIHLADREDLSRHVTEVPDMARRLADRYWPGPVTLVLPGRDGDFVGVRLPAARVARDLIRAAGVPVVASSANRSGAPPACDARSVVGALDGDLDLILDGGETPIRTSSCVVRIDRRGLDVLREGILTAMQVEKAAASLILCVCTGNSCRSPMAKHLFRKRMAERLGVDPGELRRHGWRVEAAGLVTLGGGGASSSAVEVMREYGCDLTRHEVRRVESGELRDAERIYAMTAVHRSRLIEMDPGAADRIALLALDGSDVPDPICGTVEAYRDCARTLDRWVRQRVDAIIPGGL